ncbi:hypothetical protein J4407_00630 [Candidatus Pacearchaeota archaeon]|nr:hypothetical protein [Candidatus Pacearchaeota archaeon]
MLKNFILIQESDFNKARNSIRKNSSSGKEIVFSSADDELNRMILEKEKISVLMINQSNRHDKMKQRDSGFNHVMAKIAKKNNVIIGINLDEILNSEKKKKAEILARIRQNVKICNKNKLKMKFISFVKNEKDSYDLKALGLALGMPTWMANTLA